ncbi:MAG: sugar ABC transporter ATP-binding protein [Planctomycetota bacterium]
MSSERVLYMERISKAFPGVQALQSVDFELFEGEVHALVGENGAGKSTLIKVLSGVHRPDRGRLWLRGQETRARSPRDMMDLGVRVIYQELNLVPGLSVAENLFLGREPIRHRLRGVVNWPEMHRQCRTILERFGLGIDPRTKVGRLGVAHQQIIEIAKAISCRARIVVMDEPTSALTDRETEKLFAIIRDLRSQGVSVIYISHRLDEIRRIADRVTVLRDGRHIITSPRGELSPARIIQHMVGRRIDEYYPKEALSHGDVLLSVEGLSQHNVCRDVSFELRRGEILGLAGLVGSGRTEIAELLFGRRKADQGVIRLGGHPVRVRTPRHAVELGVGLIPEERKTDGLVLDMSVFDNVTLSILKKSSILGLVPRRRLARRVKNVTEETQLKSSGQNQQVKHLSGGNQQKVVLAKWLLHECQVYIFDEPTRGVDVGAKREIYRLMEKLARRGAGIIMISSDMPEVLHMSDRILVVCEGHIAGELQRHEATQESVLRLAVGREGVETCRSG